MILENPDYFAKVEYLSDTWPECPLLPKLKSGNNALNCIYLVQQLEKAEAIKAQKEVERQEKKSAKKKKDDPAYMLEMELRHLKSSRGELANKFQIAASDNQRAFISKGIQKLTNDIIDLLNRMDAYRKYEELPEVVHSEKYPVPSDPVEMYQKRNSLRTMVSRLEKEVKRLFTRNPNDPKLPKKETKLRELKIHLQFVQNGINRYKSTQS